MTYIEFFLFFSQYLLRNVVIIGLVGIFIFLLQKPKTYSIFDPYFLYYCLPIVFSFSVILILYIDSKKIQYIKLLFSNIIQIVTIAFFIKKEKNRKQFVENYSFFYLFFILHTIIFLIAIFIQFKMFFATVFSNKLAMYTGHGVLVYLYLILPTGEFILLMLKRYIYRKKKMTDYCLFFILLFAAVIGGGKGSIVSFVANYFFIKYYFFKNFNLIGISEQREYIQKQNNKNIIICILMIPMVLLLFKIVNKDSETPLFLQLLHRMVSYGDIYFLAYPTNVIEKMPKYSFIQHYFISLVNPIRKLFPFYKEEPVLGFEIIKEVLKVKNPSSGPNSRFDVFLQLSTPLFFNYIWCFILGCIYSFNRTRFFNDSKSFLGLYLKIILLNAIGDLFTDYSFFASRITGLLLIIPFLYFVSYMLYCAVGQQLKIKIHKVKTINKWEI